MRARGRLGWALLLLLVPAAAAAPTFSVASASVEVHGGDVLLARFAAATFQGDSCAGLALAGGAATLHVEVDRINTAYTLNPSGAPEVPLSDSHPSREAHDYANVTVTLSDVGPGCRVLAWAGGELEATLALPGGAAGLAPAAPVATTHQGKADGARQTTLGGPGLLEASHAAGLASLRGGLRLGVWDATLEVRAGDEVVFRSILGERNKPAVEPPAPFPPVVPGGTVTNKTESEAYLQLGGADLLVDLPAAARLLAAVAHVDAPAGFAQFHNALVGTDLEVTPLLNLSAPLGDLHADGSRLLGDFRAGTAIAVARRDLGAGGLPLSLLALALVPVAAAALGTRRWALAGMRKAADADQHARAARLAALVWPGNPESRATRVVCLLRMGRLDAAARALHPRRWRSQQATRSFLLARLEVGRGDAAAARRHLADCFLLAPAFVADARADPALHGLLEGALSRVRDLQAREGYA